MSPYIVTAKRIENGPDPHDAHHGSKFECPDCGDVGYLSVPHFCFVSRRAVATPYEMRAHIRDLVVRAGVKHGTTADPVTDAGGTIGPLPDGSMIEVKPIGWPELWQSVRPDPPADSPLWPQEQIIAAYNAAQEA